MDFESLVKGNSSPVPPPSSSVGGLDPWDAGWADSSSANDTLVSHPNRSLYEADVY
jgi:hypothetical protein